MPFNLIDGQKMHLVFSVLKELLYRHSFVVQDLQEKSPTFRGALAKIESENQAWVVINGGGEEKKKAHVCIFSKCSRNENMVFFFTYTGESTCMKRRDCLELKYIGSVCIRLQ